MGYIQNVFLSFLAVILERTFIESINIFSGGLLNEQAHTSYVTFLSNAAGDK